TRSKRDWSSDVCSSDQKPVHGWQNNQCGRRCDRQRARDGLLPGDRRGCWPSGGAMVKIGPPEMIPEIERAWAETFRYAARSKMFSIMSQQFRAMQTAV